MTQPTLFDEPVSSARYYMPETDRLPAFDTCKRYKPDGPWDFGFGSCPLNGPVKAGWYCAQHE